MTALEQIQSTLHRDGMVTVSTHLRCTQYLGAKYEHWFSDDARGDLYVQSGAKRVCISFCQIKLYQKR